jgi:hypothetical protein
VADAVDAKVAAGGGVTAANQLSISTRIYIDGDGGGVDY